MLRSPRAVTGAAPLSAALVVAALALSGCSIGSEGGPNAETPPVSDPVVPELIYRTPGPVESGRAAVDIPGPDGGEVAGGGENSARPFSTDQPQPPENSQQ